MKFLGVTSFLKALPIWAIPKGKVRDVESTIFLKLVKICCAVSGLRYAKEEPSSTGPTVVLNIKLKALGSVRSFEPQAGHSCFSK